MNFGYERPQTILIDVLGISFVHKLFFFFLLTFHRSSQQ